MGSCTGPVSNCFYRGWQHFPCSIFLAIGLSLAVVISVLVVNSAVCHVGPKLRSVHRPESSSYRYDEPILWTEGNTPPPMYEAYVYDDDWTLDGEAGTTTTEVPTTELPPVTPSPVFGRDCILITTAGSLFSWFVLVPCVIFMFVSVFGPCCYTAPQWRQSYTEI